MRDSDEIKWPGGGYRIDLVLHSSGWWDWTLDKRDYHRDPWQAVASGSAQNQIDAWEQINRIMRGSL